MGWLKKKFKQVGKKLKKFFKSDVGKAVGTIALAVAGFYAFGPGFGTAAKGATDVATAAGTTGIQTGIQTGIPTATSVTTTEGSLAALDAAAKTASTSASTAGQTALQTATQTAGTKSSINSIATNVINNANAQVASGNTTILNPSLTDAVTETINVSAADPATASRVAEAVGTTDTTALQNLQAEYSQRGLTNLADATQAEVTAVSSPTTSQSLLAPEMQVETFDTNLLDGPSQLRPSSETLAQRTNTAGSAAAPTPDPLPPKEPFFSDATKQYATQVGVGTTTSLLTGAILGPGDEPEGGGMLVSYDKAEAPAGSYVADVSRTYQQNGGMPLKFDMYKNGTVPMYGPSAPRSLANNPFIYAS